MIMAVQLKLFENLMDLYNAKNSSLAQLTWTVMFIVIKRLELSLPMDYIWLTSPPGDQPFEVDSPCC